MKLMTAQYPLGVSAKVFTKNVCVLDRVQIKFINSLIWRIFFMMEYNVKLSS